MNHPVSSTAPAPSAAGLAPALWQQAASLRRYAPQAAFFVLLVFGWELMARWLHSPLVPTVAPIGKELSHLLFSGFAINEIGITFSRMSLGFVLALCIALPVGIASAVSKTAERFFEPGIILGLTVPGLVWALLCVIWFGVSLTSSVIAVALGVLPSLAIAVQQGVRLLGRDMNEMVVVFGLPARVVLRKVWLPLLYSFIISGCRVGFSLAWKVIVLVEIFGMSNGVGYQLNSQFSIQNVEGVIAWTLAFWATMLMLEHLVFRPLEWHANRWKKGDVL